MSIRGGGESGGRATQVATHDPTSGQTPKDQAVNNVATGKPLRPLYLANRPLR